MTDYMDAMTPCPVCGRQRWAGLVPHTCPAPTVNHFDVHLLTQLHKEVAAELVRASAWPPMNSAHEGYGVLAEEFAELFDHVRLKQSKRDLAAMQKEAIQVAAMALRFAHDICNEERGRK